MPRQPVLNVVRNANLGHVNFGTSALEGRPVLVRHIGNCLLFWAMVEANMSLVLGQLLGANNEAALAVFQALRRSSAQREAISEAARVSLNQADNELLAAILNVHKSIEAERNALAHGHFGMCSALPNSLLWMSTSDYLALTQPAIRALPTMPVPGPKWEWSEAQAKNALASMWVYKSKDIKAIFKEIMEVSGLWFDFPIFGNTSSRATLKNGLKDTPDYVVNRVLPKS